MSFSLSYITSSSQPEGPHSLRDGALNACSLTVLLDKLRLLLALTGCPQRFLFRLRVERDGAPGSSRLRAVSETGADPTIGVSEFNFDNGLAPTVLRVRPALAGTSLGTGYLLLFPIHLKLLRRKAFAFAGLPFLVAAGRSVEIHAVIPFTLDQEFGLDIAGIHQVTVRQTILVFQRFMNDGNDLAITGRGRGGFDMRNQVQLVLLAAFRQVDLVADPRGGVLFGIVGLR